MNETWELLLGVVLPLFIDLVNSKVDNSKLRYAVSVVACLLVGVGLNFSALSLDNVLQSGAWVFASSQTVYKAFWSESGLREKLQDKL